MGERRTLSARSATVLRLIAEGRTYEQILSVHPEMSYLDIFGAAREALEVATQAGVDYAERLDQVREVHPRAHEKWSPREDAELAQLVAGGETVGTIAVRLRRQPGAIRARMMKLNLVED